MGDDYKLKTISYEKFESTFWTIANGSQPIDNGEQCVVLDKDGKPTVVMSCCHNCGDFSAVSLCQIPEPEIKPVKVTENPERSNTRVKGSRDGYWESKEEE